MAEYALLVGLVALVVAITLVTLGTSLQSRFVSASSCVSDSATC